MGSTLVLGIGNTLLKDEGVGVHVIDHLKQREELPGGITLLDGGTLGFSLVADIGDHNSLIVIDAAELGEAPGSIRCMENGQMDSFLGNAGHSVHEVALLDLVDMARLTGFLPQQRALFGIQPEVVDWGVQPSPAVQAAISGTADQVIQLVKKWAVHSDSKACARTP
jgi:hydrogenase maturation protease